MNDQLKFFSYFQYNKMYKLAMYSDDINIILNVA